MAQPIREIEQPSCPHFADQASTIIDHLRSTRHAVGEIEIGLCSVPIKAGRPMPLGGRSETAELLAWLTSKKDGQMFGHYLYR